MACRFDSCSRRLNPTKKVTGVDEYRVNLSEPFIKSDFSDFTVVIQDVEYHDIPVNEDMFPLFLDGEVYGGALSITSENIELRVAKNGDPFSEQSDAEVGESIDGLQKKHFDQLVLSMVAELRNF